MALVNFVQPKFHVDDDNGNPLDSGKVYTYEAGTTTFKATYQDIDGSAQNSNPVILDSRGEADIFLDRDPYKIIVKDKNDVTIITYDNYQAYMSADDAFAEDLLINADARINQLDYASGTALVVGDYLFDMWKCTAAGIVTFTAGDSITLSAGCKIAQKNDLLLDKHGATVTAMVDTGACTISGLGLAATSISPGLPVTWQIDTSVSDWFEVGSAAEETFGGLHIIEKNAETNILKRATKKEFELCSRYLLNIHTLWPDGTIFAYTSFPLFAGTCVSRMTGTTSFTLYCEARQRLPHKMWGSMPLNKADLFAHGDLTANPQLAVRWQDMSTYTTWWTGQGATSGNIAIPSTVTIYDGIEIRLNSYADATTANSTIGAAVRFEFVPQYPTSTATFNKCCLFLSTRY